MHQESLLSSRQVEQYGSNGFLVVDGVLSAEEVKSLRRVCALPAVTARMEARGHREAAVHALGITGWHDAFLQLARHPGIVGRIRSLLGPDIQLHHSKLATKPPQEGKGRIGWHQDLAYFPHTNTDLLAVMVMLDDATPENGCMQMVRGSHKNGLLDISMADFFADDAGKSHHWSDASKIEAVMPKAGGISIHHCLALHGSPPNLSGKPRRGIVFEYRADDAYQLSGGVYRDTGLLITGKFRGQVRCDIGTVRIPPETLRVSEEFAPRNAWSQSG